MTQVFAHLNPNEPYGNAEISISIVDIQREIEIGSQIIVNVDVTKMSYYTTSSDLVCKIESVVTSCTVNA